MNVRFLNDDGSRTEYEFSAGENRVVMNVRQTDGDGERIIAASWSVDAAREMQEALMKAIVLAEVAAKMEE